MTESVVVAVDGGTASAAALDWVIDRARSVDMQLEIITVADIDWIPQLGSEWVLLQHEQVVQAARERVASSGAAIDCSTTVEHDRPVPGLLAASRRADLLVIGSHKTAAAVGLVHGTLPLAIAAQTHAPLVVVPVGWEPSEGPVVAGVDDATGVAAMGFAAVEAERAHMTLEAVRAWSLPALMYGAWAAIDSPFDEFQAAERAMLSGEVARVRAQHRGLSIDPRLEYGRPSLVLAQHAQGARLSVVGSHGRGAIAGLLLGSVGHDLLMNMPSPVAIVPENVTPDDDETLDAVAAAGARS